MRSVRILSTAALVAWCGAFAAASDVQLSLNLRYTHPARPELGGTWNLVALTDDPNGLASVRAIVSNVTPGSVTLGPMIGAVDPVDVGNGPRPAVASVGGVLDLAYGQDLSGSVVTGVGTGAGAPGDVGRDVLTNAAWSHASLLASGAFPGGGNSGNQFNRPQFTSITTGEGTVSTSARLLNGTTAPFSAVPAATLATAVRGDSVAYDGLSSGDANRDWRVDLDDMNIWINHLNEPGGWDEGDIDGNGFIGAADKRYATIGAVKPAPANTAPRLRPVDGPELSHQLHIARIFDANYQEIATAPLPGTEAVYELVVAFEIDGLDADELGFGGVSFDIDLDGVTEGGAGGWLPNASFVDSNGPAAGGNVPMFSLLGDMGPSPSDLEGILATVARVAPDPVDPRTGLGQSAPVELGRFYVSWDGLAAAAVTLDNVLYAALGVDTEYGQAYESVDSLFRFDRSIVNSADFNGDLTVDAEDLAAWKTGFGTAEGATPDMGDANGDGAVNGADLLVWQRQLGAVFGTPPAAAVPEPGAALAAGLWLAAAIGTRRRARWRLA